MAEITRRGMFGLAGGAIGLAGCAGLGDDAFQAPFEGSVSFDHGVASGDPAKDGVILWTRVTPSIQAPVWVIWQVFADVGLTEQVAAGAVETSAARDYTVKVDVGGLAPGREYFYIFTVNTEAGPVPSRFGRTKTLAASGTAPVRAAVISCSNYPFGFFHVYDALSALEEPLDVVIHLGDYFYEYGRDGYGGKTGARIDRQHEPATEITKLADYRARHAQYKADAALQRAHAAAPWICTWDDHESANNSYRTGAQNHTPETEGSWTDRKQIAVQAYLEWMPVRDPAPGRARSALWRRFDFGDIASIMCLETRLTGRSEEISWTAELAGVSPEEMPAKVRQTMGRVADPARTMLGSAQENWLSGALESSVESGKPWQVLANQIIMARVKPPRFRQTLSAREKAVKRDPRIEGLIGLAEFGQPLNLDAWDGFPAARERLYASAKAAGANLVTLTGDTHTAWANELSDAGGEARGVEFGCTSVTSPGFGQFFPDVAKMGEMFEAANSEVVWHDPNGSGFTVLTIDKSQIRADFYNVSDVTKPGYTSQRVSSFRSSSDTGNIGKLEKI